MSVTVCVLSGYLDLQNVALADEREDSPAEGEHKVHQANDAVELVAPKADK